MKAQAMSFLQRLGESLSVTRLAGQLSHDDELARLISSPLDHVARIQERLSDRPDLLNMLEPSSNMSLLHAIAFCEVPEAQKDEYERLVDLVVSHPGQVNFTLPGGGFVRKSAFGLVC